MTTEEKKRPNDVGEELDEVLESSEIGRGGEPLHHELVLDDEIDVMVHAQEAVDDLFEQNGILREITAESGELAPEHLHTLVAGEPSPDDYVSVKRNLLSKDGGFQTWEKTRRFMRGAGGQIKSMIDRALTGVGLKTVAYRRGFALHTEIAGAVGYATGRLLEKAGTTARDWLAQKPEEKKGPLNRFLTGAAEFTRGMGASVRRTITGAGFDVASSMRMMEAREELIEGVGERDGALDTTVGFRAEKKKRMESEEGMRLKELQNNAKKEYMRLQGLLDAGKEIDPMLLEEAKHDYDKATTGWREYIFNTGSKEYSDYADARQRVMEYAYGRQERQHEERRFTFTKRDGSEEVKDLKAFRLEEEKDGRVVNKEVLYADGDAFYNAKGEQVAERLPDGSLVRLSKDESGKITRTPVSKEAHLHTQYTVGKTGDQPAMIDPTIRNQVFSALRQSMKIERELLMKGADQDRALYRDKRNRLIQANFKGRMNALNAMSLAMSLAPGSKTAIAMVTSALGGKAIEARNQLLALESTNIANADEAVQLKAQGVLSEGEEAGAMSRDIKRREEKLADVQAVDALAGQYGHLVAVPQDVLGRLPEAQRIVYAKKMELERVRQKIFGQSVGKKPGDQVDKKQLKALQAQEKALAGQYEADAIEKDIDFRQGQIERSGAMKGAIAFTTEQINDPRALWRATKENFQMLSAPVQEAIDRLSAKFNLNEGKAKTREAAQHAEMRKAVFDQIIHNYKNSWHELVYGRSLGPQRGSDRALTRWGKRAGALLKFGGDAAISGRFLHEAGGDLFKGVEGALENIKHIFSADAGLSSEASPSMVEGNVADVGIDKGFFDRVTESLRGGEAQRELFLKNLENRGFVEGYFDEWMDATFLGRLTTMVGGEQAKQEALTERLFEQMYIKARSEGKVEPGDTQGISSLQQAAAQRAEHQMAQFSVARKLKEEGFDSGKDAKAFQEELARRLPDELFERKAQAQARAEMAKVGMTPEKDPKAFEAYVANEKLKLQSGGQEPTKVQDHLARAGRDTKQGRQFYDEEGKMKREPVRYEKQRMQSEEQGLLADAQVQGSAVPYKADYRGLADAAGIESAGMRVGADDDKFKRVDAVHGTLQRMVDSYQVHDKQQYAEFIQNYAKNALGGYELGVADGQIDPSQPLDQWSQEMLQEAHNRYIQKIDVPRVGQAEGTTVTSTREEVPSIETTVREREVPPLVPDSKSSELKIRVRKIDSDLQALRKLAEQPVPEGADARSGGDADKIAALMKQREQAQRELVIAESQEKIAELQKGIPDLEAQHKEAKATADTLQQEYDAAMAELTRLQGQRKLRETLTIEQGNAQETAIKQASDRVNEAARKYNEANDVFNSLEGQYVVKQNRINQLKFDIAWQEYESRRGRRGYRSTVTENAVGEPHTPDVAAKSDTTTATKIETQVEVKMMIGGREVTVTAENEEQFKGRIGDLLIEEAKMLKLKGYSDDQINAGLKAGVAKANELWDEGQRQAAATAAQSGSGGTIPVERQRYYDQVPGAKHPDEFVRDELGEHAGMEVQSEEDVKEGMAIFDDAEERLNRLFQGGQITDAKMKEANAEYLTSCYVGAMRNLGVEMKLGRAATVEEFVQEWGKGHEYAFPKIKAKLEAGTLTLADLVQANIEDRRERIQREVIPMLDQHPIFKNLPDNVKKGTVHAIELLDLTEGPSRWGKLDKQEWRDRAHTRILKVMFGIDKEGNFLDGWEKAPYRSYVADKYADMTPDERKEDAMKIGGWVDLHSRAHIKAIHEHDGTYGLPGVKKGVTGEYIPKLQHVMRLKKARELEIWTMAHYFMGEKKMPPPPPPEILKEQLMNDVEEVEAILRLEEQARAGKRTEVGVHYSDVLGEIEGPKAETLKDIKAQVELMGFNPDKIAQMRYFNPATRKWETFFDGTKGFDASKLANIDDFEKFYCVDDEGRPITFRKTFEQRPDGSTWEHFAAETKSGGDQPTFFSVTRERLPDGTESMQVSVGEHGEIKFGFTGGKGEIDWAGLHAELDKLKDPQTGQISMNADTAFRFANLFGQNMKEGTGASFALKYGEWNFAFGDFEKVDSKEGGTGFQWNTTEISSDRFNWRSDVDSKVVIHADGTNEMVLGGKGGEAIRIMGQGNADAKTVADRWIALGAPDGGLDAIEKYRLAAGLDTFDLNVDMGAIDRAFNARPGTKEALLAAFIKSANHDLQAKLAVGQEAGKFDIQNMGEGLDKLKAAELNISYEDLLALKAKQEEALSNGHYTTLESLLEQNTSIARTNEADSKKMAEGVVSNWYEQVTSHTPEERMAHVANAWLQAESRLLDDREAMFSDNYGDQLHLIAGQHMDEAGYLTKMSTSRGFAFGHRGEKGMWYVGAEEEDFYARSGALRDVGPDAMMTVEMRGQMQKMYAGFERECLMKGFTLGARGMYGKGETGPGVLVAEGENGQKYQIAEVFKGTEREIWVIEGKAQYEGNISDEFKVTARIKGMPGLDPEKMMAMAQDKIPGAKSLKLLTRIGVGIQSKHGFSIGGEFSPEVIGTGTHRIHGGYNKQVGDLRLGVGGEMMRFGQGGFKLAKVSASANYELGGFNVGGEVSVGGSEGIEYTINVGNKEIPVSLMDLLSADPKILAMRVGFEVGKKGFSEALDAITDAQENARLQKLGPLFTDSFTEYNTVDMELGKKGGELFGLYERYHNLESADNVSAADKQKQMTEIVTAMLKKQAEIEQYSGDSHIIHDKIAEHIESLKVQYGATAPTVEEVNKMDVGKPAGDLMWQKRDVGLVTDNGTVKIDYRGPEEKFEIHLSDTMKDAADQEFAAIGDEKTRHIAMAYRELLKRSSEGAHTDILARMQEDLRQRIQKHADTVDPFEIQEKLGILLDDKDAKAEQLLEMTHEKLMKDKNFDKLADLAEANLSDKYKAQAREILRGWQEAPMLSDDEFKKQFEDMRGSDMAKAEAMVKERQATLARIQEQHAQLEAAFHASAHERAVTKMDEAAILQEVDGKLKGDKAVLTSRELWAIERRMKAKGTLTESAAAALQELRRQAGFKDTATIEHRKGLDFLIDSLAGKKARVRTPDAPSHEMPMVSADRIPSSGTADNGQYARAA